MPSKHKHIRITGILVRLVPVVPIIFTTRKQEQEVGILVSKDTAVGVVVVLVFEYTIKRKRLYFKRTRSERVIYCEFCGTASAYRYQHKRS